MPWLRGSPELQVQPLNVRRLEVEADSSASAPPLKPSRPGGASSDALPQWACHRGGCSHLPELQA